jgi:hypothetical protein
MWYYTARCYYSIVAHLLIVLLCVCKQLPGKKDCQTEQTAITLSRSGLISDTVDDSGIQQTEQQHFPRVHGYYFVISGDFDGNGTNETLTEHFYSSSENRDVSKLSDSIDDYDQFVNLIIQKDVYSFVMCDSCTIDTLHIASGGRSFGLAYLKNEGDLNGDGSDEVSYVVNFTDWSQLNTWYIMTYKNGAWRKLYTFPIWEWQLPVLPYREYAVNGSQKIPVQLDSISDTNDDIENFDGLVKKISTGIIQVAFRNGNNVVDTMLVNLK